MMLINDDNYRTHQDKIGAKAKNLFELKQKSINVPGFFCLSSDLYYEFIRKKMDQITEILSGKDDIRKKANACQALFKNTEIDRNLASRILQECDDTIFYSVRSTALQEDAKDHSFAGLFDSFLFVKKDDMTEHVKKCWLSAFNANILQYCYHHNIDPLVIRLGVIVQHMIRSASSGILFTANPAGSITEMVIVAGYGLGEGVVANKVETDMYLYDTVTEKIEKKISCKKSKIDFDFISGKGTRRCAIEGSARNNAVLKDETIHELVLMGKRMYDKDDAFLDIEWAINSKGELFILQCRPITTLCKGKITIFDNSNIVESYPGITLPLTFSITRQGYERNFSDMFSNLICRKTVLQNWDIFKNLLGYVQGRMYYNITNWYEMTKLLPISGHFTIASLDDMIGIRSMSNPGKFGAKKREARTLEKLLFIARLAAKSLLIKRSINRYKKTIADIQAEFLTVDVQALNNHELLRHMYWLYERYSSVAHLTLTNDFLIMLFAGMTKKALSRYGFSDPNNIFNDLMCGEEGMESVLPVHSVIELAQLLKRDDVLVKKISNRKNRLDDLTEKESFKAFNSAFETHLELYGTRCPEELKLEKDTFKEKPERLLKTILRYVPIDISVEKMKRDERKIRKKAEKHVRQKLKKQYIKIFILTRLLNHTRLLLRNRESGRLDRGRIIGILRTAIRALGANLVTEKVFDNVEDIHYLTIDELNDFINGLIVYDTIKEKVDANKKKFDYYKENQPEERLIFSGTVGGQLIKQKQAAQEASEKMLMGVSCSPGQLEAEAIVVRDPSDAGDVSGKIIVAKMTDPGWVFLMIAAAGLIAEKGSILSHTAIIGRELGIPTIVGVSNATTMIKSGQKLHMDASKGKIELYS